MVKPFAKQQSQRRSTAGTTSIRSANRKVSPAVPQASQKRSVGSPSTAPKTQHTRKSSGDVFVVNDPDTGHIRRTSSTSVKSNGSSGSGPRKVQPYSPPPSFTPTNSREFKKEKEVDFFTGPTLLSRLIQNQKFASAIARLEKQGPQESSVWVCTKRKLPAALQYADVKGVSGSSSQSASSAKSRSSGKKTNEKETGQYTFRQLPIHMACGGLFRVDDPALRTDLEQLIARLVIAYPEGCARRDHQGRYPLHECIWYNAAPPIISALLMAAPEIARIPDMQGVTPSVLNEHRQCPNPNHKTMVRGMLKKSPEFWRTARQEAEFRMKHRDIPAADATITSTSVLASSMTDEETIVTNDKLKRMQAVRLQQQALTQAQQKFQSQQPQAKKGLHPTYQSPGAMQSQSTPRTIAQNKRQLAASTAKVQPPSPTSKQLQQEKKNPDSNIKSMARVQLEERAFALEQKLAECYEHIYALNQQLTEVKGAKAALQAKVDKFTSSDSGKRVVELENEKEDLQFHLARSKAVLEKHGISLEEENNADDMPPLPPLPALPRMNVSFSTEDTADNTSDENSYIEEIIEEEGEIEEDETTIEEIIEEIEDDGADEDFEGSAEHLSQEQEKLAMLKQQLQTLTNDHLDYQDRLRNLEQDRLQNMGYNGDVIFNNDDEMSTKSELTMDFTATPFQRLQPERPGPDGDASLVGIPSRMPQVVEGSESISRTPSAHDEDQVGPLPPPRTGSVLGDQSLMTMDSVIAGAMLLNRGEGLSPELIAMWRATSVASVGTSMNDQAERYMEETSLAAEPPLQKRPGSDQASVV